MPCLKSLFVSVQVPRLTALLRAQTRGPESNGALDLAAAYVQRRKILEAYQKRQAQVQKVGSAGLLLAIFGTARLPKDAQR